MISQEDPAFAEMDWQEEEMGVQTTEAARIGAALLALNGRITRIEALLARKCEHTWIADHVEMGVEKYMMPVRYCSRCETLD